jgi:hypothetical protein
MKKMHNKITWQVWKENEEESQKQGICIIEKILFEGSESACKKYYKQNGGSKSELHVGYDITDDITDKE